MPSRSVTAWLSAHAEVVKRQAALLDALTRAPETPSTRTTPAAITDFIKQIAAATKHINVARVTEKEPFLVGGRTVDTFFKRLADPLNKAQETLNARLTKYERDRADGERRAREEAARIEREEAQRLQAIADERERAAREVERAADTDAALDDAIDAHAAASQAEADARQADADAVVAERAGEGEGGATPYHTRRLWIIQFASHVLGFCRPGQGRAGP